MARLVRQKIDPTLQYRVLVTTYDWRNGICTRILEQMRFSFLHALFETVIEVDTRLCESPVVGKPITLYEPSRKGRNNIALWPRSFCAMGDDELNHKLEDLFSYDIPEPGATPGKHHPIEYPPRDVPARRSHARELDEIPSLLGKPSIESLPPLNNGTVVG